MLQMAQYKSYYHIFSRVVKQLRLYQWVIVTGGKKNVRIPATYSSGLLRYKQSCYLAAVLRGSKNDLLSFGGSWKRIGISQYFLFRTDRTGNRQ